MPTTKRAGIMKISRLSITPEAEAVLVTLHKTHGKLVFHQSGGCCDGSSPMCLKKSEFMLGARDILIGEVGNTPFYMSQDQFTYFKNMHINIDVTAGRGSSFSLEIPLGVRFLTVSRLFTDDELQNLEEVKA